VSTNSFTQSRISQVRVDRHLLFESPSSSEVLLRLLLVLGSAFEVVSSASSVPEGTSLSY
jgi:hypothetical protein